MMEFTFSNDACLSTTKDIFFDNFLKLLEKVISRAIVLWADWLHLTGFDLANIFSFTISIIHFYFLFLFISMLNISTFTMDVILKIKIN